MKNLVLILTLFICTYAVIYCGEKEQKKLSPLSMPEFVIEAHPGCDTNSIFLATTSSAAPYIMIINNEGTPLFSQKTAGGVYDFKPQPNGVLSYYDINMDGFYILDANYNLIDSIRCLNGIETDIHELRILPNGNYLILGFDTRKVDMSLVVEGGRTSATIIGHVIQEIDKNKNLIFEWKTFDHIEITDSYTDLKQATIDFTHGNSIDVDFDGNFLVSLRNTQEVIKVNRVTGEVMWRLGGKKNQFKFINDTLGFSWQHAARRLPNGNLMLFDNGTRREPSIMSFSRALEYKIDENIKTAALVWQYRHTPDLYSIGLGYSQRLPGGNTFISWGETIPAISEVTESGEMVFELTFKPKYSTYRAYRYPWKPESITQGETITSTVESCIYNVSGIDDTASVMVGLINSNPFPVTVTLVTNKSRAFYIPYEFPAQISANAKLVFPVYFRPGLGGSFSDTLNIFTNFNDISLPLTGEITTGVKHENINKSGTFALAQNYPNPFNPDCIIEYNVAEKSFVSLKVYDILGKTVAMLVNTEKEAGSYMVRFSGKGEEGHTLASGVYFYSLNINGSVISKKMILEK